MISGIGISAFYASTVSGAGSAAPARESEAGIKAAEDKNSGRIIDPVPVKPANIGGSSAIAAQAEASRPGPDKAGDRTSDIAPENSTGDTDAAGLTEEERAQVKKLAARDREVRAHEAAHKAVGGQYAGAVSFTFQSGPDGRRYAVGGEVPIDVGAIPGDPDATIRKLRVVRRAALAPVEPSAQDRSIAATAAAGVRTAQVEKRAEAAEERGENASAIALQQPAGPPQTTGAPTGSGASSVIRPENRD